MDGRRSSDAQSSGNTKPSLRARSFQLTLNEVDKYEEVKAYLDSLKTCDYYISCEEEAPTTGHKHIHIYCHFSTSRNLSLQKCQGAHVEICRGSPQENIAYIEKDGKILHEKGTRPRQGARTVGELKKIEDPDELNWNEYNTWQKIKNAPKKIRKDEWNKTVEVIYITGPSGAGKSNKAHELVDDEFDEVKYENGFWNGVTDGMGCCIYDDFRGGSMKPNEFINFIDYRVHNLNVKGGCVKNKYSKIIITSVQHPEDLYMGVTGEPRKQWMRRLKIIELDEPE